MKVGSALIAPGGKGCSAQYLLAIAGFITRCRERGIDVVLVSSGSVAAGRSHFDFSQEALPVPLKKAMAAVGQNEMMSNWSRFFDFPCAQVLLTHGDLGDRERYVSIKNTLDALLENQILPIVNENDTVATDALRVGDNDNLAALVATVVDADTLLICSDVDGLYDKDPTLFDNARRIPLVEEIDESIFALAGPARNAIATGGMRTKVEAAEKATSHGIDTYIVNGRDSDSFEQLLRGDNPGTLFLRHPKPLPNRQHWLRHTLRVQGELEVDAGAAKALLEGRSSLLSGAVKAVEGDFERGDAVIIREGGQALAKGICQYSAWELNYLKGRQAQDVQDLVGDYLPDEVIHRDNLMLLEENH
ncbi:glutamate 5-kinase [Gallaecimonas kandeliae]|uniref:glutamate 5-kinase n=1 Tax=Gallaecimonas kandeliae TaxID=3029055 RepID=UPI0030102494